MASKRVQQLFENYFSDMSKYKLVQDFSQLREDFTLLNNVVLSSVETQKRIRITSSRNYSLEIQENSGLHGVIEIQENAEFNLDFFSHPNSFLLLKCIIKKGASCVINGYYSSSKDKNWIRIELIHEGVESKSDLHVLGYNSNTSQCICDGLVQIGKNAQNSSGYQTLTNFTLSNTCKTYSEPQLEIFNPNVECSHGSTISPIDTSVLYYLKSRGLSEKESITLLTDSMYSTFLEKSRRELKE